MIQSGLLRGNNESRIAEYCRHGIGSMPAEDGLLSTPRSGKQTVQTSTTK